VSKLGKIGRSAVAGPMAIGSGFAILTLPVAPVVAGAAFLAGLFAPHRRVRSALFLASLLEAAAIAGIVLIWVLNPYGPK